ncbi:MAG: bifunctional transcriptional activator/DNA repair enzyme protein Ada, partial [Acidobacteria bacterium]
HPKRARVLDPQIERVQTVCRELESSGGESVKLSDLAIKTGVSLFHLQRTFKSLMGISPRQYLEAKRFGNFKTSVREGSPITAALYDAGFNSSSRVYENASDELGMTPATYGRGGRGINIKFTIHDSPLGRLLVAITERGVCSVAMGDRDSAMEK